MNQDALKLMCILAHPDDESLGMGGILARYAAEGVHTSLITATRAQRGWQGAAADNPGQETLGQMREVELRAAVEVLGVQELILLDYVDGELDRIRMDVGRQSAACAFNTVGFSQALALPALIVAFNLNPLYSSDFSWGGRCSLLPYTWLYHTRLYVVLGTAISLGALL